MYPEIPVQSGEFSQFTADVEMENDAPVETQPFRITNVDNRRGRPQGALPLLYRPPMPGRPSSPIMAPPPTPTQQPTAAPADEPTSTASKRGRPKLTDAQKAANAEKRKQDKAAKRPRETDQDSDEE